MSKRKKRAAQPVQPPKADTADVVSAADCKAGWLKPCCRHEVHGSRNTRRARTRGAKLRREMATYG